MWIPQRFPHLFIFRSRTSGVEWDFEQRIQQYNFFQKLCQKQHNGNSYFPKTLSIIETPKPVPQHPQKKADVNAHFRLRRKPQKLSQPIALQRFNGKSCQRWSHSQAIRSFIPSKYFQGSQEETFSYSQTCCGFGIDHILFYQRKTLAAADPCDPLNSSFTGDSSDWGCDSNFLAL